MPGSTGPDNNTYTIPEVQLGDTFNFWRDATNTAIYKLNKLKIYDAVGSGSIGVTYGSTGAWNAFLAPTITEGLTFTQRIVFSNGITAAGVYSSRGITAIAGIWTTGGLSADRLYVGGGSTFASGLYVGGGATFASTASVSGNFAVNTNNLVVNTNNNRVGVGTASPGASLDVNGTFRIVSAGTTSGSSSTVHPLQIINDPGTISAFLGDGTSTSAYKGNSYSAALRFNGANVAWGDIAYYPQGRTGGFVSGGGEFRFVKSGSVVTPTANAMVSVGELLSEGQVYAGATGTFATNVSVGSVLTVTGTLGVGTTTPTSAIHINKGSSGPVGLYVNASDGGNNAYGTVYANGSLGAVGSWANGFAIESVPYSTGNFILSAFTNDMVFQTNMGAARTEVMRLKAGGSLGIGTASPARKVHVQSGDDTIIRVQGPSAKANGIEFTDGTNLTQLYAVGATYSFVHRGVLNHQIGSDKAFYYAGGSFGIGNLPSASNSKLHVETAGGKGINSISNGGGGSTNYSYLAYSNGSATSNIGLYANVTNATTNVGLYLDVDNPSATDNYGIRIINPRARANSWGIYVDDAKVYLGGSLGVGTTNPQAKFHVDSTNPPNGILGIVRNSALSSYTGAQLQFTQQSLYDWVIGQPANTNAFAFWTGRSTGADGTERMRIDGNGRVNIPTTTSTTSTTTGGLTLGGGLGVGGAIWAGSGISAGGAITSSSLSTGAITSSSLSTFAGITSSAIISCATAPTQGQHLANKTYVDAQAASTAASAAAAVASGNVAFVYMDFGGQATAVTKSITLKAGKWLAVANGSCYFTADGNATVAVTQVVSCTTVGVSYSVTLQYDKYRDGGGGHGRRDVASSTKATEITVASAGSYTFSIGAYGAIQQTPISRGTTLVLYYMGPS